MLKVESRQYTGVNYWRVVNGQKSTVSEDVRYGRLAVSASGTLADNSSGTDEMRVQLTWVSRSGKAGAFPLVPAFGLFRIA